MRRRSALKLLGVTGLTGIAGCRGQPREPDGTQPLTDSFDDDAEPSYWHRSLAGFVSLATADGLFVRSNRIEEENSLTLYRSTVSRIGRDGSDVWSRNLDEPTRNLRATGDTVYLFRSNDATTSFRWGDPRLEAREPTTGDLRWDHPVDHYPNFVGTATDVVFVGSTNDNPGQLPVRAFGASSGRSRWQTMTPMPRDGLYTHGLCLVHGYPNELTALDAETGARRWQQSFADIEDMGVFGDTLVVLAEGGASAFSLPDGNQRWHRGGQMQTLSFADAPSGRETTVFLGETDGTVAALDPETGDVRWSTTPSVSGDSEWVRGIAPAGDTVVVRKWGTLYGLDSGTGEERWRQVLTPFGGMTGPVAIDRTVFVVHSPTDEGFVVKTFDVDSGRKQWRFQSDGPMPSGLPTSTVFADQFVVAADKLYGFVPSSV